MNAPAIKSNITPNAPPRSKLPAAADAKVRSLKNMADEAWTLANKAKDRVAEITNHKMSGMEYSSAELAEMEAAQERHRERYERTKTLIANLEIFIKHYIEALREPVAEYIRPSRTRLLPEGVSAQQQVAAVQQKIIECRTQIMAIEHAPMPRKDQVAVVERWVDRFLANTKPRLTVIKGELRMVFNGIATDRLDTASHMQIVAIAAFFAGVDRDTVVNRMVDMLPEPSGTAISMKDREQQIADLRDRMLHLERDEEATIARAAQDGIHILRRPDASPEAVLGLSIGRKARAAA